MTPYLFWQVQAKKITYIVIIFVVIPLLIPGCRVNEGKGTIQPDLPDTYNIDLERPTEQLSEKLIDDPSPEELQWPEDWLHGIPCESPCWQGITPGISTVTETIKLLEELNGVYNVNVGTRPTTADLYDGVVGDLTWTWEEHGKVWGAMDVYGSPLVVYSISIGNAGKVTLEQVITAFGSPSHVRATVARQGDRSLYFLVIIFYKQGFALQWDESGSSQKPKFDGQWTGFVVKFFEPTEKGFARVFGGRLVSIDEIATPWQGMFDFDTYCQGEFCTTQ